MHGVSSPSAEGKRNKLSFARTVQRSVPKPANVFAQDFNALHPVNIGNKSILRIPESLYQSKLKEFEFAIHARLLLNKGDTPRFASDIKQELMALWKTSDAIRVVPLGKGFFSIIFTNEAELATAKSRATWKLSKGIIRIREWVPDFDPYKESSALSQVWLRIYYLPHEYWHPEVIIGIARYVGLPIKLDGFAFAGHVGHFARVLVDMDVSKPIPETLTVDEGTRSFEVEFVYENLPHFCGYCKLAGHNIAQCRRKK
ncbi:uncharacterized protein LOC131002986 [Salvia miltiorrhiza]|uniref:uncharacterized protein LOC131002986 n=1 Tax=Salvia miltiorrhiza TaxID=226208 RepID=UPI0025ACAF1A|nr:uncharacterized protein LOC131002986 [Salvia miltiorrhiza]